MTNSKVYCKVTAKGILSFYITNRQESFFLFNQNYKKSLKDYYFRGVDLNSAIDKGKAQRNNAIINVMNKLPKYISYIEKEYNISIFEKTKKYEKYKKAA